MQNPQIHRTDCTMPFYIRFGIHGEGVEGGVWPWNQFLTDIEGRLQTEFYALKTENISSFPIIIITTVYYTTKKTFKI